MTQAEFSRAIPSRDVPRLDRGHPAARSLDDLPRNARDYVGALEKMVKPPSRRSVSARAAARRSPSATCWTDAHTGSIADEQARRSARRRPARPPCSAACTSSGPKQAGSAPATSTRSSPAVSTPASSPTSAASSPTAAWPLTGRCTTAPPTTAACRPRCRRRRARRKCWRGSVSTAMFTPHRSSSADAPSSPPRTTASTRSTRATTNCGRRTSARRPRRTSGRAATSTRSASPVRRSRPTECCIFVAEHGGSIRHELVAVDQRTGATIWRRSVDLPGANPQVMQQRGALAITGGHVWVPYGALAGDCGDYKGRVVGVPWTGPARWSSTTRRPTRRAGSGTRPAGPSTRAGICCSSPRTDPAVLVTPTTTPTQSTKSTRAASGSTPSRRATGPRNADDVGLGSQGVALIGTKWAVLGGKSGPVYVLRQGDLGGVGGEVSQQDICKSFGGAAVQGNVVYLPCIDGVRAVRVDDAGTLHVLWHTDENTAGSPVIGGGRVWALDQAGGVLHALDPKTGKTSARRTSAKPADSRPRRSPGAM